MSFSKPHCTLTWEEIQTGARRFCPCFDETPRQTFQFYFLLSCTTCRVHFHTESCFAEHLSKSERCSREFIQTDFQNRKVYLHTFPLDADIEIKSLRELEEKLLEIRNSNTKSPSFYCRICCVYILGDGKCIRNHVERHLKEPLFNNPEASCCTVTARIHNQGNYNGVPSFVIIEFWCEYCRREYCYEKDVKKHICIASLKHKAKKALTKFFPYTN